MKKNWETIINNDTHDFLRNATGESSKIIDSFFHTLKLRNEPDEIMETVIKWNELQPYQQSQLATHHAGLFYVGRFVLLMSYLSDKREEEGFYDE